MGGYKNIEKKAGLRGLRGECLLGDADALGIDECYSITSCLRRWDKRYRLISYKFSGIGWRVVASHAVTAWNFGVDRPCHMRINFSDG
ncbi:MAG: hypothetical protein FD135_4344 [Comamonadaceae bacterium]|nr:MAG: hypothetical protein FD135_4344 [Comamonadaceae bacterium]